jgi:hypothetical protein
MNEKSRLKKMAKQQSKMMMKSERIIPHISKEIVSNATTLEKHLKLQTLRSNQIYKNFISISEDEAKLQTHLEMNKS